MNKKIVGIFICMLFIVTVLPVMGTIPNKKTLNFNSQDPIVIYVNFSAIDDLRENRRPRLNDTEKQQLKNLILEHLRENFASIPGVTFEFTDNSSKENIAKRKVKILDGTGYWEEPGNGSGYCYGKALRGTDTVEVYLKNFYIRHRELYTNDRAHGDYNVSKLANAIGAVAGHELGHSYCVGHNRNVPPNKMTDGSSIDDDILPIYDFQFDAHSRETISRNARRGVNCSSYPNYFLEYDFLHAHFYDLPLTSNDYWEGYRFDADFSFSGQLADSFEVGWLTLDSDNGVIDRNSQWDFIYKTSMDSNTNPSAELLTFFENRTDAVFFTIRGIKGSKWQDQWFPVESANVELSDEITRPDGIIVSRHVSMGWDVNYDGRYDVYIELTSTAYNGFTYGPNIQSEIAVKEISGGFGVSVLVENIGLKDAFNIQWSFDIKGMVFIGGLSSGKVDIKKGGQYSIKSDIIVGFGPAEITVNVAGIKKTINCFLVGPFVINIKEI